LSPFLPRTKKKKENENNWKTHFCQPSANHPTAINPQSHMQTLFEKTAAETHLLV